MNDEVIDQMTLDFALFMQRKNSEIHPSRKGEFNTVHVSDVLGCLRSAVLTRYNERYFDFEGTANMRDGMDWEEHVLDWLKYQLMLREFELTDDAVNYPIKMSVRFDNVEKQAITELPCFISDSESLTLIARPDFVLAPGRNSKLQTAVFEIKRRHERSDTDSDICFFSQMRYNKLKGMIHSEFHKHELAGYSFCRNNFRLKLWEGNIYQLLFYTYLLKKTGINPVESYLAVVHKDKPKFIGLRKLFLDTFLGAKTQENHVFIDEAEDMVMRQVKRRLYLYKEFINKPGDTELLWAIEGVTRWNRPFCSSCPFLFKKCRGLVTLSLSYFKLNDFKLIQREADHYGIADAHKDALKYISGHVNCSITGDPELPEHLNCAIDGETKKDIIKPLLEDLILLQYQEMIELLKKEPRVMNILNMSDIELNDKVKVGD